MCYTGICSWEGVSGECRLEESHCPEQMEIPCECGCSLKQMQDDGEYHCLDCNKIVD